MTLLRLFPTLLISLVLLATAIAGCLGGKDAEPSEVFPNYPAAVHPFPSGDEWKPELTGPFDLKEIIHLPIMSFDSTIMDGWVLRPDVPEGVKVPIVLWSAPYFGQCVWMPPTSAQAATTDYPSCHYDLPTDPQLWDNDQVSEAVPVRFLFEHGYGVAVYNVRGTGNSGGCFEWFGPKEQRDQYVLVERLATLEWSNGRIGMMGLSYHGTTPWEAAIQNPPSLKTIVVAGMVGDAYTFSHTPQGATFATIGAFNGHFAWRVSLSPPINGPLEHFTANHAPVLPERACPDVVKAITEDLGGTATDVRDAPFWAERRLIDKFPDITTSVFITHGFLDHWGSGHQQQENAVWKTLTQAPKRQLEGQYGHMFPNFAPEDMRIPDWNERLLEWLDFWLKGIGDAPPREGIIDYQDNTGAWHESRAWPPVEAREEVLYLVEKKLTPTPAETSGNFNSYPVGNFPEEAACSPEQPMIDAPGELYVTEPATEDMMLAGNPIAYLRISSDLPGGLVAMHLYDIEGDPCNGGTMRRLGAGVADLRFHEGNFQGKNFPVGVETPIRLDIVDFAEIIPAGHRLGALMSRGDPIDRNGQPHIPFINIHGDGTTMSSHLLIPVVTGTFGGSAPSITYPPRPFVPVVD